jgi:hypothetical protein
MENKKGNISHKVGDFVERVGQKISDAGAKKVGRAIYNAGDKLEHSSENKSIEKNKKI